MPYNRMMVVVRPQRDDDIEQVAAVQVRTWRAAYAGLMPADVLAALDPAESAGHRRGYVAHPHVRTVVADDGGRVAGFATFGPFRRGEQDDDLDHGIGQVYALYVDPDRWGGGLGRSLLAAARADLIARGMTELRLWVLESNAPARRFYERSGLAADGERSSIRLVHPDGAVTELADIRYSGPLRARPRDPDRQQDP
jgi:ribosomal protein S18 acetylase RimI-like enzyme